ncbi:MAG: DUF4417 domain-containing protein [Actinomycetia bacterium]|nr:DUF4417 domain-containing protein [Actinomycetes bacterium]
MVTRHPRLRSNEGLIEEVLRTLVMGMPPWFPLGTEVVTDYQIPVLPLVPVDDLPTEMLAYDKIGKATQRRLVLGNFYVDERKLRRLIRNPERFISQFEGLWGITSPDFSIWDEAPLQFRVTATWLNRALGRLFADHGIRVVPNLRWCDHRDYDHCFAGVASGSVVAISTHGLWRVGKLRHGFIRGLYEMVDRLAPPVVILHGTDHRHIRQALGPDVEVVHYLPERSRVRRAA